MNGQSIQGAQESAPTPSDEEIVADLFRLARTGRFKRVAPLLREAESMYPAEPADRIEHCLRRLGQIFWETDYQGFATDYRLQPKARA